MGNPATECDPPALLDVSAREMEGRPRLHTNAACPRAVGKVAGGSIVGCADRTRRPGRQALAPQAVGIGSRDANASVDQRAGAEILGDDHLLARQGLSRSTAQPPSHLRRLVRRQRSSSGRRRRREVGVSLTPDLSGNVSAMGCSPARVVVCARLPAKSLSLRHELVVARRSPVESIRARSSPDCSACPAAAKTSGPTGRRGSDPRLTPGRRVGGGRADSSGSFGSWEVANASRRGVVYVNRARVADPVASEVHCANGQGFVPSWNGARSLWPDRRRGTHRPHTRANRAGVGRRDRRSQLRLARGHPLTVTAISF